MAADNQPFVTGERLSPRRRLLIGACVVAMGAAGFAAGRTLLRPEDAVTQPFPFDHQLHVEKAKLKCSVCHSYYQTSAHSGLPTMRTCLDCHDDPEEADTPGEKRILELTKDDRDEPFHKLFMMPDHVHYSHRQHVVRAGIECDVCHGAIASATAPPPTPLRRVTMDTCIDCHREQQVQTDCTSCHR